MKKLNSFLENPLVVKSAIHMAVLGTAARSVPLLQSLFFLAPLSFIFLIVAAVHRFPKRGDTRNITILLLLFLLFGCWALLTSLWSASPTITIVRSLYFLLMAAGISCGIWLWSIYSSSPNLDYLLPLNLLVVFSSLISLLLSFPADAWTGGRAKGFMGFTGHPNWLGGLILFSIPSVIAKILECYQRKNQIERFNLKLAGWGILFLLNVLILILSYSRASIVSLLVLLSALLMFSRFRRVTIALCLTFLLGGSVYISSSDYSGTFDKILMKGFKTPWESRTALWAASYTAALRGGITGLGYGMSDQDKQLQIPRTGGHFENGRYIREKGNSALALIEETGLVGLGLFLLPLFWSIRELAKGFVRIKSNEELSNRRHFFALLLSCMIAFFVYAQFEAWWVGVTFFNIVIYISGLAVAGVFSEKLLLPPTALPVKNDANYLVIT